MLDYFLIIQLPFDLYHLTAYKLLQQDILITRSDDISYRRTEYHFSNLAYKFVMALQLKKRNYKFPIFATGALVFGAGLLIVKTYPHLLTLIPSFGTRQASENKEDNSPVEVEGNDDCEDPTVSTANLVAGDSLVDIAEWTDDNLRSFLMEVSIHHSLGDSRNTNDNRKKSILLPMLIMTALSPLLNQFKRILNFDLNILLTIRMILFRFLLSAQRSTQ